MNLADERQRLLRAVLDAPDDDGPRSVYSDWLQQQGDPRGELIAVQLEIERLDAKTNGERVRQLFERQSALLLKHRRAWLKETFGKRSSGCGFRRGFVVFGWSHGRALRSQRSLGLPVFSSPMRFGSRPRSANTADTLAPIDAAPPRTAANASASFRSVGE